ETSFTPRL
nr:leukopyrokinin [Rhyparobia maderae]